MGSVNSHTREVPKIIKIDLRALEYEGVDSYEMKKERSGIVEPILFGNVLKLVTKQKANGTVSSVALPDGDFVYHTHPRECPSMDDCSLIPPSADDMKLFAKRKDTQAVISKNFTYILRLKKRI